MSSNEHNEEPKDNELPESEQADGLTAEQAAEVRPYDEVGMEKKAISSRFWGLLP